MSTRDRILNYIREQVDKKGYPPTVREIGDAVGLASTSTVQSHLDRLERDGILRRDPNKPRAIELLNEPKPRMVPAAQIKSIIDDLDTIIQNTTNQSTSGSYAYILQRLKQVLA